MRFHQDSDAVAQLEIAVREARRRDAVGETRGRVVVLHERGIERQRQRALRCQFRDQAIAHRAPGRAQGFVAGVDRLAGDRDVVPEFRAVGDVQVHFHRRIPGVDEPQHRLHFRAVGLHVIAIEVVALRGGAEAHFLGPALVGAVPCAEILVAVDVEHGHEQQHDLAEGAFRRLAVEHLPQGEEAGVLAVDLAGVDAALHQQHRQAVRLRRVRGQCAAARDHQQLHRPAFGRGAEGFAAHRIRVAPLERLAQRGHFVVAAGALEARAFGDGRGIRGCGGCGSGTGEQGGGEQGAGHGGGTHSVEPRW